MEKRVNKKIEIYVSEFKNHIRNKIIELQFCEKEKINDLLESIFEFQRLTLQKDDLIKRKRIKNAIPVLNRCYAKRANGEQCTRRRKDTDEFCGTHVKGTPNGLMNAAECQECTMQKMEVFAQDIHGIVYYIDKFNNVYNTEDVLIAKENPQIIAKYINAQGVYSIPTFGLV